MSPSSARSRLAAAGARWWADVRRHVDSGEAAPRERLLQAAADRVHHLVAELHDEPTDTGVRTLADALDGLGADVEAAVRAGVPEKRAEAVRERAHAEAASLLFDVLAPLMELPGPEDRRRTD
jgi:hypothetical protein